MAAATAAVRLIAGTLKVGTAGAHLDKLPGNLLEAETVPPGNPIGEEWAAAIWTMISHSRIASTLENYPVPVRVHKDLLRVMNAR